MSKTVSIAIHAHKINMPLLANFPKERIDINPFHTAEYFNETWGELSLKKIYESFSPNSPILLFLDAHTINNIKIIDINDPGYEVYLFLGDTQHGSLEGMKKLINLSRSKSIKKIYVTNNPQHAHWFCSSKSALKKVNFIPLGLANYEYSEHWFSDYAAGKIVHVGNVSKETHPFRFHICHALQLDQGSSLQFAKTANYMHANAIFRRSLASLNISLNSDLSFRLSEASISGAVVLSDKLGLIQRLNIEQFNLLPDFEFENVEEALGMLQVNNFNEKLMDLKQEKSNLSFARLDRLDDVLELSIEVIEPRTDAWISFEKNTLKLESYVAARNKCIEDIYPVVEYFINNQEDIDLVMNCLDLPRLKIIALCRHGLSILLMNRLNKIASSICNVEIREVG